MSVLYTNASQWAVVLVLVLVSLSEREKGDALYEHSLLV